MPTPIEQILKEQGGTLTSEGWKFIGDLNLSFLGLTKLPKIKSVGGSFRCYNNNLTSLEGCPQTVGGYFCCNDNNLTSLVGCPQIVGGNFRCYNNNLTSLEGCPQTVGGSFYCEYKPQNPSLKNKIGLLIKTKQEQDFGIIQDYYIFARSASLNEDNHNVYFKCLMLKTNEICDFKEKDVEVIK